MTDQAALGTAAVRTLAAIRIVNGTLGLLAPHVLVKRTSADPTTTEPYYAFRMFGIRTIVLGYDLLTLTGADQERARTQAVIIHATDTASALLGGLRGDVPPRGGSDDRGDLGGQHGAGRGGEGGGTRTQLGLGW